MLTVTSQKKCSKNKKEKGKRIHMAHFLFTSEIRFPANSAPPNHSGFRLSWK